MFNRKERSKISKYRPRKLSESDNVLFSDKLGLVVNFIGAFCALIGLIELIRLIGYYWETYGLLANFPLEISVYTIGIAWILVALVNFLTSENRFLERLR